MKKRSLSIAGHRTSISIEEPFWDALKEIAAAKAISLAALVAEVDSRREDGVNLSSALRVATLANYRSRAPG
ncbi:aryl-sulfate sulfotransferase [Kaistia algarum]|uniref:ribbon-helix-helix domain-containing protein n=1 Tax=Kaistia algarum TaxID=2083279 RepID=UPI000CE8C0A4|nr:ribbon-helix-helix domain-containing protein [Kaistia algarum]MCX5515968.1 ribbon-helix-helix domain-containing protein [Kaistia algarum]PPE80671.1 aryl-sulfate sulfotransferase [Kaistia algarum]